MNRNIPPVRTWRVRCYSATGIVTGEITVQTINKRFARWLARENMPTHMRDATRITVSLVRKPNMCR